MFLYCRRRIFALMIVVAFCFILLIVKLFYLQVIKGPGYAREAVAQRANSLALLEGRGDILDRNGVSLLGSSKKVGLAAFPSQYSGLEEEIMACFPTMEGIEAIISPPNGSLPFWLSYPVRQNISADLNSLPGLIPVVRTERYGAGLLAAHVIGYLRESEGKGVSGIELAYDQALSRGQRRVIAALVDGKGRLIPGLGYRIQSDHKTSYNVTLSIDASLQREVEKIMDARMVKGAVVVMDPWNGDILSMASRPDFHPGDITKNMQQGGDSLLNRVLWDYQPGSVFKLVVAAAALEENMISLFQTFRCRGGINVDGLYFPCSNLHRKEEITLAEAFAHSCNTVFIQLAIELGPDKIVAYGRELGLGEATGTPLGDREGLFPESGAVLSERAQANLAIGQGDMLTTPLQVAVLTAAVANGGQLVKPRLVMDLTGEKSRVEYYPVKKRVSSLSPATANKLKYLMQQVVEYGTACSTHGVEGGAAAKTGTAESGRLFDGKPVYNRWITGFYPLEKPAAVIVVFAEDLKEGTVGDVFHQIVRRLRGTTPFAAASNP